MGFFGMDASGNAARDRIGDQAGYDTQQYKDWLSKGNAAYDKGTALTGQYEDWNRARTQNGIGSVADIQARGQEISPQTDEVIGRNWDRLSGISNDYNNLPGNAYDTMATIQSNTGKQGQLIGQNYDDQQGEIQGTYGRNAGRYAGANDAIQGDIQGRYGALDHNVNQGYGDLRGENASTYGGLASGADQTYEGANKNLEMLRPGSQYSQAQTARSFAPEIANTMTRLRRSGVGADSLQASSVMQHAERDRARGMDDAAAAGTAGYVGAKNNLALGQMQNNQGLRTSQLNNELGLGQNQLNKTTALSQEQGNLYRGQVGANAEQQSALDALRQDQAMKNTDNYTQNTSNWYNQANQNAVMGRNMNLQDWNTKSNLAREQNQNDLTNLGLYNDRYNQGLNYTGTDLAERNAGANANGQLAANQQNYATTAAQTARGFGGDATKANQNIYDTEAQNAGWGLKMIGGIAGSALGAYMGKKP